MQESQQTAETPTKRAETRNTKSSELDSIAALLAGGDINAGADSESGQRGDGESENESSEAESETTKKNAKPRNLNDLAKSLGVKVAELYALEIPFDAGDGTATVKTLGEIKDAFTERDSIEVDRLTWEETKAKREQQLTRSAAELQQLVSMLPKSAISQEMLGTISRQRAEYLAREERLVKNIIPEWQDEKTEVADRDEMREHLAQFGFAENYLDSIADHKTLAFVRAATKRAIRIERALESVKTVRKAGHKPSVPASGKARPNQNIRGRNQNSQVAKVAELLNLG